MGRPPYSGAAGPARRGPTIKKEGNDIRKFIGEYWVIYYLSYPVFAAILLWLHRHSPRWQEDWIGILADILGVALAGAVAFTIFSEVLGPVVLLIPKAFRRIKNEGLVEGQALGREEGLVEGQALGREEGLVEGQAKERQAQSRRREEAYRRFGIEVDGVQVLPNTPEIEDFLDGKHDDQS